MYSQYLTFEELEYALEHEGLDVQERTLRFWISKGVLEKPLRKPFKHADGRARYFPKKVVGEIMEILRLQEAGWKLKQIKSRLRNPVKVNQSEMPNAEGVAKLWLSDYLGNGEARDRMRAFSAADDSTPEWRRLRNFLVARLTRFVGRKQAVRSVTTFMVGLSSRELARLLKRASFSETSVEPVISKEVLGKALSSIEEPVWDGPGAEPLLSRRLRSLLDSLRSEVVESEADSSTTKALGRLRAIRTELQSSIEFLSSGPDV